MQHNFLCITVLVINLLTGQIAVAEFMPDSFVEEAPGVFVRYGSHKEITRESVTTIANHGFVAGDKSVAIIDPGGSPEVAKSTLEAVENLIGLPVSHVIITHMHPDHSLGLAAFEELGDVVILGHPNLVNSMLSNLDFFKDNFIKEEDHSVLGDLLRSGRMQSIESEHDIDLGNRTLTLQGYDSAHTNTDLTIFDNKHHVLWAGDLLFVERLPALDGSLIGWLEAIKSIDKLRINTVVPGHGRSGPWLKLVGPQRKYLKDLLADTRKTIKQGKSLSQYLQSRKKIALFQQWQLHDRQHRVNQSRAYTELEWE